MALPGRIPSPDGGGGVLTPDEISPDQPLPDSKTLVKIYKNSSVRATRRFFIKWKVYIPSGGNPYNYNPNDWNIEGPANTPTGYQVVWVGDGPIPPENQRPTIILRPSLDADGNVGPKRPELLPPPTYQPSSTDNPSAADPDRRPHAGKPYLYADYKWKVETLGPTGGRWILDPDVSPNPEYLWSSQSPADLGWKPNKPVTPEGDGAPEDPAAEESTDPDTSQADVVKRPGGPLVFNPPLIRTLSKDQLSVLATAQLPNVTDPEAIEDFRRRHPFGEELTAVEAQRRLVTITQPLYLVNQIQDGQTEDGKSLYKTPWGFRALFNPTAWGYSGGVFEGATISQAATAQTDLLVPGTFSYQLDLMLNRSFDLQFIDYRKRKDGGRLSDTALDELAEALYVKGAWRRDDWLRDNWWNTYNNEKVKRFRHQHPLRELYTRGTEYDIDFLYRVINGDPVNKVPGIINKWTSNRGFLTPMRVRITLGASDAFEGQITNITVNHVVMTKMMVPTVTFLTINVQRWPNYLAGKAMRDAYKERRTTT